MLWDLHAATCRALAITIPRLPLAVLSGSAHDWGDAFDRVLSEGLAKQHQGAGAPQHCGASLAHEFDELVPWLPKPRRLRHVKV